MRHIVLGASVALAMLFLSADSAEARCRLFQRGCCGRAVYRVFHRSHCYRSHCYHRAYNGCNVRYSSGCHSGCNTGCGNGCVAPR